MQSLRLFFSLHWQSLATYGGLFIVLGALLVWQLDSLLPGFSKAEADTFQASLNLRQLLDNPLNAPFLVLVRGIQSVVTDSLLATRAAAAGLGLATLSLFCWLVRQWHDSRTAILGTILLGTSAWFLHVSRAGTPEVLLFGVFALAACGFWLKESKHWVALLACFLLAAGLLYVPGMVWFIAAGLVWQWRTIDHIFKRQLVAVSLGAILFLAALAPLAWALYREKSLIMTWMGLPDTWPAPLEIIGNILKVPYHLLVNGPENPAMWLGTTAVLDIFCLAMFLLGGMLYLQKIRLVRTPLFLSIMAIATILIGLGSSVTMTVIIPFVYLVAATGTAYLISQWLRVFPRNPIARSVGMALLAVVVGLAVMYQLSHYFVGWPQARDTHSVYTIRG